MAASDVEADLIRRRSPWEPGGPRTIGTPWRVLVAAIAAAGVGAVAVPNARDSWETLRIGVAPGSRFAMRAAPTDDGWVVVGYVPGKGTATPAAWRVEGRRWIQLGTPRPDRMFSDVAVVGSSVIAVGSDRGRPALFETPLAGGQAWRVAWTQPDGQGELTGVAASPGAVVAVGWTMGSDGRRTAIAVTSGTNAAWEAGTVSANAWLTSVAATDDGFVAAGQTEPDGRASVWLHGTEGWTAVPLPADDTKRSFAVAVASAGSTTIVAGQADLRPVVWTGSTTEGWSIVPLPGEGAGERTTAVAVAPNGTIVVAGSAVGVGDVTRPLAWASKDATTWRSVGVSGANEGGLSDAVAVDGRLVVWGNARTGKRISPEVQTYERGVFTP